LPVSGTESAVQFVCQWHRVNSSVCLSVAWSLDIIHEKFIEISSD